MPEALVISKSSLLLILNAADLYTINEKFRIIQILHMFNLKSGLKCRIFCASGLQYFNL
jgi:hypothetical protein